MSRAALLPPAGMALLSVGVALVFAAVLAPGLLLVGVVLIDIGMVLLGAAALLRLLRPPEPI